MNPHIDFNLCLTHNFNGLFHFFNFHSAHFNVGCICCVLTFHVFILVNQHPYKVVRESISCLSRKKSYKDLTRPRKDNENIQAISKSMKKAFRSPRSRKRHKLDREALMYAAIDDTESESDETSRLLSVEKVGFFV